MFERLSAGRVKGYTRRGKRGPVRVREYSREQHIKMLMKKDGLTRKEAVAAVDKFGKEMRQPTSWREKQEHFKKETEVVLSTRPEDPVPEWRQRQEAEFEKRGVRTKKPVLPGFKSDVEHLRGKHMSPAAKRAWRMMGKYDADHQNRMDLYHKWQARFDRAGGFGKK